MKVSIWDLDYYYDPIKINCFNPDVMKISSFHKQKGDQVNFVLKRDDIYRPYDLYYVIKEKGSTPNPPLDFFTNKRVKWWGKAFKRRINWRMDAVMLACRPDYLLYPEKNTAIERSEQLRLLDNDGQILPIRQDWRNSFKNKKVLVTDSNLWTTDSENLKKALKELIEIENVTFLESIWLPKIVSDKEIMELFLQLKLRSGSILEWVPIHRKDYTTCSLAWRTIRDKWPHITIKPLPIKISTVEHWENKNKALQDFIELKNICIDAKKYRVQIEIMPLQRRLDTPYFLLFEEISKWTKFGWEYSWLEWLTISYGPGLRKGYNVDFWSHPNKWNEVFRDLLRQTYQDHEFLICGRISYNDIPWSVWDKEFNYGL